MSKISVIQFGDKSFNKVENITSFILSKFNINKKRIILSENEDKMLFQESLLPISEIFNSLKNNIYCCVSINFEKEDQFLQVYKPLFFGSNCNFWHVCVFLPMDISIILIDLLNDNFLPEFILLSDDDSVDIEDYDCMKNTKKLEMTKSVSKYYFNSGFPQG